MGNLSKIESMKNAINASSVKVFLECSKISYTEPFKVFIRTEIGDDSIKMNRVYLRVRALEEINIPDVNVVFDHDGRRRRRVENVHATNETVDFMINIAEGQFLEANSKYEWYSEIRLPEGAPPIYNGRFCQHAYKAFAGIDCLGNDPDSGWILLHD